MTTITSVIDDTLSQIRKHGLKESSVTDYQKSLFQPILKYFIQRGCECYDRGLLEEFLSYREDYQQKETLYSKQIETLEEKKKESDLSTLSRKPAGHTNSTLHSSTPALCSSPVWLALWFSGALAGNPDLPGVE